MIQSKQPPPVPIIDHCKVPVVNTLIVMNVETVSPESKHPAFIPWGFVLGLENEPEVKSTVL
jgi:hypothetical protein